MPFSDLKIEWPAGTACDARDLCLEIEILERRIRRLHRELAPEEFAAARGALAAAKAGNTRAEVTAAIDALRRAYTICKDESAATRSEGFLIPQRVPAVENRIAFHKELAAIAGMVAMLYRYLGAAKEERDWRVAAILDFDKAVEKFAARIRQMDRPDGSIPPCRAGSSRTWRPSTPILCSKKPMAALSPASANGANGTSRPPARRPARRSKTRPGACDSRCRGASMAEVWAMAIPVVPPHPVPLPMGEGTPSQRARRNSLSHRERAGVRGNARCTARHPRIHPPTPGQPRACRLRHYLDVKPSSKPIS